MRLPKSDLRQALKYLHNHWDAANPLSVRTDRQIIKREQCARRRHQQELLDKFKRR